MTEQQFYKGMLILTRHVFVNKMLAAICLYKLTAKTEGVKEQTKTNKGKTQKEKKNKTKQNKNNESNNN